MELQGQRLIPAPLERTWAALNDPAVLKDCIAGCESLERDGDNAFNAALAVRIGPVNARFKGRLQLADVQPPTSYTIHFDGQGGVAGFGKGSAEVKLQPAGAAQTQLSYVAKAQVGGKIAQVGSRLVDAAASKVAQDFFQAFESKLAAEAGATPAVVPAAPAAARKGVPLWWWAAGAAIVLLALWWLRR